MLKPAVKKQLTSLHWMWLAKFTRWQEALGSAPKLHLYVHMSSMPALIHNQGLI